ncbi:MAG: 5-deoxy-glucuronate isomerase [Acidimicrobiia bacterium]|nr:5-deoxy-glucuronate isomerase [Acidimicrobiia bacterium]
MASDHHLRASPGSRVHDVTPESAGWRYLSFAVVTLAEGETFEHAGDGREVAVVPLSGSLSVEAGTLTGSLERDSVFTAQPTVLYATPGTPIALSATSTATFAIGGAPAEGRYETRFIAPPEMRSEIRGGGAATRQVSHVLAHPIEAERLILYEVHVPRGGWSGWPPHCHDGYEGSPYLEETYYFRLDPGDGWAVHRNYRLDEPFDETFAVGDGDLVLVTKGFHSSVASPGHNMWFLNYLAGELLDDARKTLPFFQPEYRWIDGRWDEGAWELPVVGR